MTLTLRPVPVDATPMNIYQDWLDGLSTEQFHEHMAGRLKGPMPGSYVGTAHGMSRNPVAKPQFFILVICALMAVLAGMGLLDTIHGLINYFFTAPT